jgi:hypothetical protein
MNSGNDSVIIGSVLMLVFGALFYYLYSRLLYSEKRINMMENILLDFKTASEGFFVAPAPSSSSSHDDEDAHELHASPQQPMDTPYEVLESIPTEQNDTYDVSSAVPTSVATTVSATSVIEANVQSSLVTKREGPTVSMNYESMNIKELQQEARNRNISGVSGMRRKEIIQSLRTSDSANSQKVQSGVVAPSTTSTVSSSAPDNDISGAHSSLIENVEQLDVVQSL